MLESDGGALVPALEIGKMIRLTGYSTLVIRDASCTSSCALIWLAGSRRLKSPGGHVGFHASYLDKNGSKHETGVGNAMVGHYLSLLNLPQKAVVFATVAGPNEINWLTGANRTEAGIEFEDFILKSEREDVALTPSQIARTPPPITVVRTPSPVVVASRQKQTKPLSSYTLPEIEALLKAALRKPDVYGAIASSARLDPASSVVLRDHIQKLYSDDRLLHRMAVQLYEARASVTDEVAFEMSKAIGQETLMKLMFSGLTRLSDKDISSFLYYMLMVPKNTTAEQCKAVFSQNNTDPMAEFRAISGSGSTALSGYLALLRKAITAELSENPMPITVSSSQAQLGEKAAEGSFVRVLSELSEEDIERVRAAFDNLDGASAVDACDAYLVTFKAMYELEGMPGNWYRRTFVNSLVDPK